MQSQYLLTTAVIVIGLCSLRSSAQTYIRYVDNDADPDGNGQSWASPYDSLQDALDEACPPTGPTYEIRMAQGTYIPSEVDDFTEDYDAQDPERCYTFRVCELVTLEGGWQGICSGGTNPEAECSTITTAQAVVHASGLAIPENTKPS